MFDSTVTTARSPAVTELVHRDRFEGCAHPAGPRFGVSRQPCLTPCPIPVDEIVLGPIEVIPAQLQATVDQPNGRGGAVDELQPVATPEVVEAFSSDELLGRAGGDVSRALLQLVVDPSVVRIDGRHESSRIEPGGEGCGDAGVPFNDQPHPVPPRYDDNIDVEIDVEIADAHRPGNDRGRRGASRARVSGTVGAHGGDG